MLRALFLQELRRSWLAHAGLFAAVLGTAALLKRATTRESPLGPADELSLGLLLFAGLLLSGLISGERCFPAAFKEGRYAFLLTLPRPRGGIWLAYLGGRLSGVLALPILLLAGPALRLQSRALWGWPCLIAALSVYLIYFVGSGTLALAIRREILVYLVGLPLLTGLVALLAYCAAYGFAPADNPVEFLQKNPQYLYGFSCGSLALALFWAVVSLCAFCRGELALGSRTARTLAEAGFASVTFVALTLIASSSSTLATLCDEWRLAAPYHASHAHEFSGFVSTEGTVFVLRRSFFTRLAGFPYEAGTRLVSSDGRFVLIRQQLRRRPLFTRLAVVDLKNGSATRWMERPGINQISWSSSAAVLNVLADNAAPSDCRGIPCEGSTSWYRLSPDLRVLSTRKFPGAGLLLDLGGCLLLVTRQGGNGRMYRLSARDGSFREILSSKLEGDPGAWLLDLGAVVIFPSAEGFHAWGLDPQGRVLHEKFLRQEAPESYFLAGLPILNFQEVWIRRVSPLFLQRPELLKRFFPNSDVFRSFGSGHHFLMSLQTRADAWRHDSWQGSWALPSQRQRGGILLYPDADSIDIDLRSWTWAAIVGPEGRRRLFLYDDRLGRNVPNTVTCGAGEEERVRLERVQGLAGLLVDLSCSGQRRFLELVPGSGQLRALPWHSKAVSPLFYRWIYLDPDGISVWLSKTGEVWQAGPGRKRLRLNPPEAR